MEGCGVLCVADCCCQCKKVHEVQRALYSQRQSGWVGVNIESAVKGVGHPAYEYLCSIQTMAKPTGYLRVCKVTIPS